MKPIVIDGRQLTGQIGGVQRYIREILRELDKIASPGEFEVLVPKDAKELPTYQNLKIIPYGFLSGLLWEQICLPYYLLTQKKYGVFPATVVPLLYPKGLAVVHDVMIAKLPELRDSIANPVALHLLLLNYRIAAKHTTCLVTDSQVSKNDIVELYGTDPSHIRLVGAGWQHVNEIEEDLQWEQKYPALKRGEFYFSLSANRKQKNFKWICEVAKRTPDRIFAIAGCQEEWQKNEEWSAPNLIHLGYISDGEIKSLMKHCKAFLFPSTYEGFGIPPMEALSVGAKVIVARASCLPEIYRDSVHYIDPYDYTVDLEALLSQQVAPAEDVLNRYGWDLSAKKLYTICKEMQNKK